MQTDARPQAGGRRSQEKHPRETHYECPVYKYPKRNDRYMITKIWLRPDSNREPTKPDKTESLMTPQINWKLKGVALVCTKE